VLQAFGADPDEPVPFDELIEQPDFDPWVAVLPVSGAVLAGEYGGWQGTQEPVLRRASANGRAASMEWNPSGKTLLSFARAATVLDAFLPPPYHQPDDADVNAALDGLALDYNDPVETGLAAVQRFTGYGLRREDSIGSRPRASDTASCLVTGSEPCRAAAGRLPPLDRPRPTGSRHRTPARPP
jgi:hypothetical protein